MTDHKFYMKKALEQAQLSYQENEVPVGAVIVHKNRIISVGRNRRERSRNALSHAEIEAINSACKVLDSWRLIDCDIYVTLEPCPMCAGAIINSRIRKVIFGTSDLKSGSCGSVLNLFSFPYNHTPEIISGVMEIECSNILRAFFKNLRKK